MMDQQHKSGTPMREPDEVETLYELSKDFFTPIALLLASMAVGLLDSLKEEQHLYANIGALMGGGLAALRIAWLWIQLDKKRTDIKNNRKRYEAYKKAYELEREESERIISKLDEMLDPTPQEQADRILDHSNAKKPEE